METRQILRSEITHASYEAVISEILSLGEARKPSYVCIANVHMVVEAFKNIEFNRIVNQAAIATPDGKPLAIFMNLLYGTRQIRISGPDLMVDLFERAKERNLSVFFYGATEEVLENLQLKLQAEHPELKVAGVITPPFRPLSEAENTNHINIINESGANILFVALGCPKQERWMAANKDKINAVMIGVGAAFPFYTGHVKRAPLWMQYWCLEWLYRLCTEPRRLFKRYLITNTLFLILIAYQMIRRFLPLKFQSA